MVLRTGYCAIIRTCLFKSTFLTKYIFCVYTMHLKLHIYILLHIYYIFKKKNLAMLSGVSQSCVEAMRTVIMWYCDIVSDVYLLSSL